MYTLKITEEKWLTSTWHRGSCSFLYSAVNVLIDALCLQKTFSENNRPFPIFLSLYQRKNTRIQHAYTKKDIKTKVKKPCRSKALSNTKFKKWLLGRYLLGDQWLSTRSYGEWAVPCFQHQQRNEKKSSIEPNYETV